MYTARATEPGSARVGPCRTTAKRAKEVVEREARQIGPWREEFMVKSSLRSVLRRIPVVKHTVRTAWFGTSGVPVR